MIKNISVQDAIASLLSGLPSPGVEDVPLARAAFRVLASDVTAQVNMPPFHRSAYDGFALRSRETEPAGAGAPVEFRITGTIAAGDFCPDPLPEGCTVRIMTGAPLPEGADCVINFERVTWTERTLSLKDSLKPWQNVDRRGDEVSAGSRLLEKGERLTGAHLGILASQGIEKVSVYRKPHAAVLSTGSELLLPGMSLLPGKIYNSNLYVFRALLEQEGYCAEDCSHTADDEDAICGAIRDLASHNDLILTTGGASVGDKDYICSALEHAGAQILFAHVDMKPGSCCYGARLGDTLVISLSGNPGAALTTFYRICLPAVRKLAGRRDFALREAMLPLADTCRKTCPSPRILKGHTETAGEVTRFVAHEGQKNGMLSSFLNMDALAELPPTDTPLPAGTLVRVLFP